MLCPDCNTYAAEDDIVCPRCGKLLDRQATEEEELMSFRQGRHLRKVQDELPPPPAMPGSTGASRSFEDIRPVKRRKPPARSIPAGKTWPIPAASMAWRTV